MRETVLWIIITFLIAIGAFEAGYIVRDLERDETKAEIKKLNSWVLDHGGRIQALETMNRKR